MHAWLRLFNAAHEAACRAGHVRLNGSPAKASATLVTGETVTTSPLGLIAASGAAFA